MLNNTEIKILCDLLYDIGKQHTTVYEIGYFGSYAKNTMSEKSDFDIVIFCNGYSEKASLLNALLTLIKKFHIIIHPIFYDKKKEIITENKYVKDNIINNEIIIYRKV